MRGIVRSVAHSRVFGLLSQVVREQARVYSYSAHLLVPAGLTYIKFHNGPVDDRLPYFILFYFVFLFYARGLSILLQTRIQCNELRMWTRIRWQRVSKLRFLFLMTSKLPKPPVAILTASHFATLGDTLGDEFVPLSVSNSHSTHFSLGISV